MVIIVDVVICKWCRRTSELVHELYEEMVEELETKKKLDTDVEWKFCLEFCILCEFR